MNRLNKVIAMKVPTDLCNKLLDVLKENADLLKPK